MSLEKKYVKITSLSHFQVPNTLTFKTSLSAKPFLRKWDLHVFAWEYKNHFHINGFALSLALKQRLDWGNSDLVYLCDLTSAHLWGGKWWVKTQKTAWLGCIRLGNFPTFQNLNPQCGFRFWNVDFRFTVVQFRIKNDHWIQTLTTHSYRVSLDIK